MKTITVTIPDETQYEFYGFGGELGYIPENLKHLIQRVAEKIELRLKRYFGPKYTVSVKTTDQVPKDLVSFSEDIENDTKHIDEFKHDTREILKSILVVF